MPKIYRDISLINGLKPMYAVGVSGIVQETDSRTINQQTNTTCRELLESASYTMVNSVQVVLILRLCDVTFRSICLLKQQLMDATSGFRHLLLVYATLPRNVDCFCRPLSCVMMYANIRFACITFTFCSFDFVSFSGKGSKSNSFLA